ncbi:MAG TPA: pyridine nucleotide-disulfide oxidoreductase [Verrucomicrobiales bacterium]|nr:pyridine nucleotide-disulfide oxidoreductase [Verrucomicrobiales bacterium]
MQVDVAILGGGSAGYAAARTAAAAGLRTVVIEGGEEVGGLCILRGCMPTKALLQAADVLHQARRAATWGLKVSGAGYEYAEVLRRKDRLIQEFADYRRQQLEDGRFTFIRAGARFIDPHTLDLGGQGRVRSRYFIVATGSSLSKPPIAGIEGPGAGCLNSDLALHAERIPESVIVLGGGAVAVEFAQFYRRFGARVTLVQRSPRILREFDADASGVVEGAFRDEGMTVHTGTRLLAAGGMEGGGRFVEFEQEGGTHRVEAEAIFNGLGRSPNTFGLGLEAAGVDTAHGRIVTDLSMRTSAPHIFAAGDVAGPYEVVHIAIQQGEVAAHNILHPDAQRAMDYRLKTLVVFTDPQVAQVGLSEQEAGERGIPVIAASHPFRDHGKSMIMEALDGFVKLLADPRTGEILGGACVGPMGGELIHEIIVAMARRMTVAELAAVPHYHPTLAEIWTYPAEELASRVPLMIG